MNNWAQVSNFSVCTQIISYRESEIWKSEVLATSGQNASWPWPPPFLWLTLKAPNTIVTVNIFRQTWTQNKLDVMTNSADPDQLASSEARFSRTRVKIVKSGMWCLEFHGVRRFDCKHDYWQCPRQLYCSPRQLIGKEDKNHCNSSAQMLLLDSHGTYGSGVILLRGNKEKYKQTGAVLIGDEKCFIPLNAMCSTNKWARTSENVPSDMCFRKRFRSACAFAPSDQSHCCLHEETLHPKLSKTRPMKILIWLHKCTGWSESLLSAHVRGYVFWHCGTNV